MTVLFLKYVPRKYKLNNDHFSCSGDNSTETKGAAQGARSWNPSHTLSPQVSTQTTLSHLIAALQDVLM